MANNLIYQLALSRVPGIGPVYAKKLIDHFGDAEAIFRAPHSRLMQADSLGEMRAGAILRFSDYAALEKELLFMEKYSIKGLFYTDKDYPQRLLPRKDAPILLFYMGKTDLNAKRIVSVVGTRGPTEYGRQATEMLIRELGSSGLTIVSGLAYGIDAAAHRAALKNQLPTIGVLGHGLDHIYPEENKGLARQMVKEGGGLLTNFSTGKKAVNYNFPVRNHIVASMSDALVVVETNSRGGSLLTVRDAIAYKKKVFAVPGRISDEKSAGCNTLIKQGRAMLLTNAGQLLKEMKWDEPDKLPGMQQGRLFARAENKTPLSDEERKILALLGENSTMSITEVSGACQRKFHELFLPLLNLELAGLIDCLPGQRYRLVR